MYRLAGVLLIAVSLPGCGKQAETEFEAPSSIKSAGAKLTKSLEGPPATLADVAVIPGGVGKGSRVAQPPRAFRNAPPAAEAVDQRFLRDGRVRGGVTLFRYATKDEADKCFASILSGMGGTSELPNAGDRAQIFAKREVRSYGSRTGSRSRQIDLSRSAVCLQRGNVVGHVLFGWTGDPREVTRYARQLDVQIAAYLKAHGGDPPRQP